MFRFVSFCPAGRLAEVTPVVGGSRVPGRGCCRRVLSVVGSSVRGVIRAFLFALDPTDAQADAFRSHCGAQRFAYNFGLELIRANLDQRAAKRTYGIGEDQLTEPVDWSAYSLAPRVERGEGCPGAVVGAEQQGGVLGRAGQPHRRPVQLVDLEVRPPYWWLS